MKFTVTHARAFTGSDITVTVTAGEAESIAAVTVTFDGWDLDELELAGGTESYSRSFAHTGQSAPGMEHTLVVTATDGSGTEHSATTQWSDT